MKPKIKYENANRNYKKGNGMEERPENNQNYYSEMIQNFKGSQVSSRDNTVKLLNSINKDRENNFIDTDDEIYTSRSNTSSSDSDFSETQSSFLDTENNTKTDNKSSLVYDNESKHLVNRNEDTQFNQKKLHSNFETKLVNTNNDNETILTDNKDKNLRKEINGEEFNHEIKSQTFRQWMNKPKSDSSKSNSSSEESISEKISIIEESSFFNKPTILPSKMEMGIKKNQGNFYCKIF
jgi:hypothetical protein